MIATDTASSSDNSRVDDTDGSMSCPGDPAPVSGRMGLAVLVGLDVELEMNSRIEAAIGTLRPVLEIDLGKGESYVLRCSPAAAVTERDTGDDDVVHLDDEEFLLAFSRLAVRDGGFRQVAAGRARLQQPRRGLVDRVGKRKVVEGRPAGASATAAGTNGRSICDTPGERQHLDFILVLVVGGFAFDVPDLRKDV